MNIHEYQAKQLLRTCGVAVPNGSPAFTVEEAQKIANELSTDVVVVKSQIHAGGRGAGRFKDDTSDKGGVRVVLDKSTVASEAETMLGKILVTKQTGEVGKQVNRLYIEEGSNIATELYLSILLDRAVGKLMIMASSEGGMDIEEVAEETPEKIIKRHIEISGITDADTKYVADGLGIPSNLTAQAQEFLTKLYNAYVDLDAEMLEINPLVITKEDKIIALDAKMSFDGNALYRHKDVAELKDETEEDPMELEASDWDLNYVKLDGQIGCMVNGAGLAMATMDIIKLKGSEPANFLDVGGTATTERVAAAFKIILSDKNVKGILVNIFGGIVRCDVIAKGIIDAAKQVNLSVPLVVRLEGTNVELGKELLANSDVDLTPADNLEDAAEKIVALVKGA
ncbi:MAG: ADP-forming succinate--CoA ligase subunit beta [Alphaproteobacteria bacterium]